MDQFKQFFKANRKFLKYIFEPVRLFIKKTEFRRRMRYAYAYKRNPINQQIILYESYNGSSISCSPFAIYLHLKKDPYFQSFQHVWVYHKKNKRPKMMPTDLSDTIFIKRNSRAYFRYLSQAKYLINNATFPSYFTKKEGQIYINTWHGTPLKKMMMDVAGSTKEHCNILRNFAAVDYLVSANPHTEETLIRSSGIGNLYNGYLLNTGLPRVDFTQAKNREEVAKQLCENGQCDITDKKVILYAPTWRGHVGGGTGKQERIDNSEQIYIHLHNLRKRLPEDTVLLLKVHNYMRDFFIQKESQWSKWIVGEDVETNWLLSAVDILITDYSSIFFDFLHLQRPILFFTFDEAIYKHNRGLYLPLDTLPGAICRTVSELSEQIQRIYQHPEWYQKSFQSQTEQFLKKYSPHADGEATKRLVDIIFYQKSRELAIRMAKDNKKRILIYPGTLKNSGITSSFINLTHNIDYQKVELIMLWNGSENEERKGNFQKIHPNVKVLYRKNQYNFTLLEYLQHTFFTEGFARKFRPELRQEKYQREFRRICGDIAIDTAVEFNGYSISTALLFTAIPAKKVIFLHSYMAADRYREIEGKRPHYIGLSTVFTLYRYFDELVSVSKLTQMVNQRTLSEYLEGKKISVVYNTLRPAFVLEALKERPSLQLVKGSGKNFVTMGRISSEKDHEKLLYAFAEVVKENQDVKLYVVGDGPLRQTLEKQVEKLSLQQQVHFTGHLDNPFSLIQQCDCFVLSSNHEGQPMVLLEAMILGKPIISTDIPGARSVVGEEYGLLVENSVAGLADGMQQYLNQQPKQKTFDAQNYNKEALEMFYKVCGIT